MFIASLIVLVVAGIAAAVALNASRIPYLREWTGAAPLEAEEPDGARNFARSIAEHHTETADAWADRTDNTVPARTITRLPEETS
jgi:hypothetical protein